MSAYSDIRVLTEEPIKDDDLPHLWSLHTCSGLDLGNTQVTDIGLRHLADVTNLVCLCFEGTHVTDAGLEYLKASTHLTVLCLRKTKMTDAGLKHLEGLTRETPRGGSGFRGHFTGSTGLCCWESNVCK